MIVYTVAFFFQPHFLTPEMINGHFPVEDTLATAASVASVGLSLPSFAEDGPGKSSRDGVRQSFRNSSCFMLFMWLIPLVWRRWSRRKCCRLPHHCSTEEEQKEVKPPPRGWQMKLPEVRPQGNECSDDVTEGNLLTASLLSIPHLF